jgi:hypothetical protein
MEADVTGCSERVNREALSVRFLRTMWQCQGSSDQAVNAGRKGLK